VYILAAFGGCRDRQVRQVRARARLGPHDRVEPDRRHQGEERRQERESVEDRARDNDRSGEAAGLEGRPEAAKISARR